MKTIGQNVNELRQQKGLKQAELAEKLGDGWNQRTVSRVEQGQDMTVSQLERMIGVLGPKVLAETSLGAVTSQDFAYLYSEVRYAGVQGRADAALNSISKASEHLHVLLDLMEGPKVPRGVDSEAT
ncbi:MAG: helix-turn-helix domain-containing protein [Brevibacterium aurantiacum]|uniref:helix-turn-helix domain-containing protein n=1 Tax=Brevibacterium aurantiacum TaxID=273384 RepID=UPI003F903570